MPYLHIWVHLVWSTKNRQPFLNDTIRQLVFEHIKENAAQKNILLKAINGYRDHVHCLILINKDRTVSDTVQLLKGESAFWINKQGLTAEKFSWQNEYWATSVGYSEVARVKKYIANQETHHRTTSFTDEVDAFIAENGLEDA
ncbi:MAG: IS200/IS605 family transposase [Saprospiraceae bacterium]